MYNCNMIFLIEILELLIKYKEIFTFLNEWWEFIAAIILISGYLKKIFTNLFQTKKIIFVYSSMI